MDISALNELLADGGQSREWALDLIGRLEPEDKANLAGFVLSGEDRIRDSALLCLYLLAERGDEAIEPGLQELTNEADPMLVRKAERALRALERARRPAS